MCAVADMTPREGSKVSFQDQVISKYFHWCQIKRCQEQVGSTLTEDGLAEKAQLVTHKDRCMTVPSDTVNIIIMVV